MDRDRGERQAPRPTPDARNDRAAARGIALKDDAQDDEARLFDVELERFPAWAHVASALVVALGVLVAVRLVPMLALLPVLVVSSVGRRFSSVATRVEVESDQVTMSRPCERRWAGAQVLDVWHDERAEGTNEARVIVASRSRPEACADLTLLDFENAAQAKRFAEAFKPRPTTVAGHCPSPVDALPSLRFLAIAAAFFGTGSWFGAFALAYFLFGAFALVRAKQIIATSEGVEIHGLFATQRLPYATIASVDADAGGIALSDGSELALPRAATCDSNLGAPPWLDPARARVFERIVSRTKRFGGPKSPETSA